MPVVRSFRREFSAGGVVCRGGKLLLVKVRNLKGDRVWTFPKGHVEKGETPPQAALREVLEETGYRCAILGPLPEARYTFRRNGVVVHKRVTWFRMEAGPLQGRPDAQEVLRVEWFSPRQALELLRYPSDFKLMEVVSQALRSPGK